MSTQHSIDSAGYRSHTLQIVLTFQLVWCYSYGDRTFTASGPSVWNSLPVQLRNPDITYRLFRRQLKGRDTFLGNHEHGALWLLICWCHRKTLITYLHGISLKIISLKDCSLCHSCLLTSQNISVLLWPPVKVIWDSQLMALPLFNMDGSDWEARLSSPLAWHSA